MKRKLLKLDEEKLAKYNRLPLSQRKLMFDLLSADAKLGLVDPRPRWKASKIFLGKPKEPNSKVRRQLEEGTKSLIRPEEK